MEWLNTYVKKIEPIHKIGIFFISFLMVGFVITQTIVTKTKIFNTAEHWKMIALTTGFLVYITFLVMAAITKKSTKKIGFYCVAPLVLLFVLPFTIPNKFMEEKAPLSFLNRQKDKINPNTIIISDSLLAPAICWSYKRSNVFILQREGEMEYGLRYDDTTKKRLLNIKQLNELILENSGINNIVLISSDKDYTDYIANLPKPAFENKENGLVFTEFNSF